MPDHISLVSDEDGDCHAEFRYHPMTMDSVPNRMREISNPRRKSKRRRAFDSRLKAILMESPHQQQQQQQ
jgi:hypothetical protein